MARRRWAGLPHLGEIVSFDRVITWLTDDALTRFRRAAIGVIFQAFNLLPTLTAIENVALPLIINDARLNAARAKAKNLLALVGLSDRLVHQPDELSDEQQQPVAIAHALINEAPRLLANEPTGNLDSHTGEETLRYIGRVRAKMRSWCGTGTAPNAVLFGKIEGADP